MDQFAGVTRGHPHLSPQFACSLLHAWLRSQKSGIFYGYPVLGFLLSRREIFCFAQYENESPKRLQVSQTFSVCLFYLVGLCRHPTI